MTAAITLRFGWRHFLRARWLTARIAAGMLGRERQPLEQGEIRLDWELRLTLLRAGQSLRPCSVSFPSEEFGTLWPKHSRWLIKMICVSANWSYQILGAQVPKAYRAVLAEGG